MTLSDLNPDFDVTPFYEIEHLYSTLNRPIWSISDINASHGFAVSAELLVCFTIGLVKNTFYIMCTLTIPIDSDSTVKEVQRTYTL